MHQSRWPADSVQADTPDLSSSSESEERPLTPRSLTDQIASTLALSPALPFAIFSPESPPTNGTASLARDYPWGSANVMDPRHGDFVALRQAVLGTFASVCSMFRARSTITPSCAFC